MCKIRWVSKSHFLVFCDEESGLPRVLLGRKIGTWEGTPEEIDAIYAEEERVVLFLVKFPNGRYGAVLLEGDEEEAQLLSKLI